MLASSRLTFRFSEMVITRSDLSTRTTFWKGRSPCSSRGKGGRTRMTTIKFLELSTVWW